jgi:uncharacterized OsmC-like protein
MCYDDARRVQPADVREHDAPTDIRPFHDVDIRPVHADRFDADDDLAGSRDGVRYGLDDQAFWSTEGPQDGSPHRGMEPWFPRTHPVRDIPELYTDDPPRAAPRDHPRAAGDGMTLIDRDALRASHESMVARLEEDPGAGLMRPEVAARLVRDVSVESSFVQYGRPFTFLGDEAADRAGHETGPSPMRYLLSGLAFCMLGWWAKGAATLDVELTSLDVRLRTFLDMRGEYGIGDADVNPQWLVIDVAAAGGADAARVLEVVDWGIAHCPLSVLVAKAIPVHTRVTLDGVVIRDEVPTEAV